MYRETLYTINKTRKIHNDVKLVLGHIDKRNKEDIYTHSCSCKSKGESESEELVF